jgi:hypothetical protein
LQERAIAVVGKPKLARALATRAAKLAPFCTSGAITSSGPIVLTNISFGGLGAFEPHLGRITMFDDEFTRRMAAGGA